ncbi:Xanthine and CO dehydrogenases maturation factor, XdhC/CoxF family [Olavius sp. associated proteobacterium Delta 1]|nr:Xanthine and CO dehydrogenases maturation factor, XdhC/CoxF family [Olavius sp. associated proteobacterium Delta 1]
MIMEITARVNELIQKGKTFCLATVIASDSTDIAAGQKAIVLDNGPIESELGDGQLSLAVKALALEAINGNKRGLVEIKPGVHVFFDLISPELKLIVCGAGHIAIPLSRFARDVGFRVTVLDDRDDFAHPSRFPGCEVLAADFAVTLRDLNLNHSTFVVVITRGHEHDADCLKEILKKETAYIGLIGSRRRVRFVLEMLQKQGIAQERLQDVFTPIGTPIGAESPAEIALSIIAELVCVRRKGSQQARTLRDAVGIDP